MTVWVVAWKVNNFGVNEKPALGLHLGPGRVEAEDFGWVGVGEAVSQIGCRG